MMSPLTRVLEAHLDFYEALREVSDGRRITRQAWEEGFWVMLHDGRLRIHKPDGVLYDLIVSEGDMFAEDWMLLPNKPRNGSREPA